MTIKVEVPNCLKINKQKNILVYLCIYGFMQPEPWRLTVYEGVTSLHPVMSDEIWREGIAMNSPQLVTQKNRNHYY
jgi:hypothetical protein